VHLQIYGLVEIKDSKPGDEGDETESFNSEFHCFNDLNTRITEQGTGRAEKKRNDSGLPRKLKLEHGNMVLLVAEA